jgi:phosphatidylglycerophosphate synthase
MLDTYGRRFVQPTVGWIAKKLVHRGFSAIQVTFLALGIGVMSGPLVATGFPILAVVALWLSGLLDVVDGSIARETMSSSSWGCLLDITFDQVVELSVIVGIAFRFPDAQLALLLLASVLLVSMTVFLTVGALVKAEGFKAFYYQPGLIERSEELLLLTLMTLAGTWLLEVTVTFSCVKFLTTVLRMKRARQLFKDQPR